MNFTSVFKQRFDVAVYGTGYTGIAAALSLQKKGYKVLLFGRRLDIAWESGRSFSSDAGKYQSALWDEFLEELEGRHLSDGALIDSAGAEVMLAARLRAARPQIQTLLGAWPVEILLRDRCLQQVTVATKSGRRTLSAQRWIDASEEGSLFRLMVPQSTLPRPTHYEYRAILFQENADAVHDIQFGMLDKTMFLEKRLWRHEFTLGIQSSEKLSLAEWMQRAQRERALLPEPLRQSALVAFSQEPIPVYEQKNLGGNLLLPHFIMASPAFYPGFQTGTLGTRFRRGEEAARELQALPEVKEISESSVTRSLPVRQERCDLFIAGAGTAGAVAALAASRASQGTLKVLCTDIAPFAGGVGSGGLITGYFHGQSGGLFEDFDQKSEQVGKTLNLQRTARSHETKKVVFEREFLKQQNNTFLTNALPFEVKVADQKLRWVKLATPEGIVQVEAQAMVDATGDGDLAALAGARFQMGRQEDGFPLSYSQPSLILTKGQGNPVIRSANFDAGWMDPTDPEDWTRARLTGIAQYQSCEFSDDFHLILLAPVLGIRQSRQIETEETLDLEDLLTYQTSASSIGQARSPLDTHSIDYEFEDEETLFWLWGCKAFRESPFAQMPYGITVVKSFYNLWVAGRAAGIAPAAAYAARMQRDMQRMGEATGYAAILALKEKVAACDVPIDKLQEKLKGTGALETNEAELAPILSEEELLSKFDCGIAGGYLWQIYQKRKDLELQILQRLQASDKNVSWLSALVLSLWEDPRAEARLIEALMHWEEGGEVPDSVRGPFGQWIDVPNWFLAISLLRSCGSSACLTALYEIAERPQNILNLRTSIALTLAHLGTKLEQEERVKAAAILKALLQDKAPDLYVRPSRSLYRALRGEEQKNLPQEPNTVDTREDHSWRLDFAITKAARRLNVSNPVCIKTHLNDERALVRRAFSEFC